VGRMITIALTFQEGKAKPKSFCGRKKRRKVIRKEGGERINGGGELHYCRRKAAN